MADREAKDLGEWIDFAQDNNASENELMSFAEMAFFASIFAFDAACFATAIAPCAAVRHRRPRAQRPPPRHSAGRVRTEIIIGAALPGNGRRSLHPSHQTPAPKMRSASYGECIAARPGVPWGVGTRHYGPF